MPFLNEDTREGRADAARACHVGACWREPAPLMLRSSVSRAHAGEFRMLEIVWRNPNRLVRTRMSVDKTWRHDSVTGEAQAIYRTRAAPGSPDVEYELVAEGTWPCCVV